MISWTALVKTDAVRLVVPLLVIDELDRKQHEGSKDMSRRARRALHMLDQALDGADPARRCPCPTARRSALSADGRSRAQPQGQRR
ncbi:PIN domain-containing protein [Streptomyces albicerus]|uniref:PIN domain-containing protein n=1 Tax=Streptomyces albicerus TaxID=2569859 RepID=UPI001CEC393D